MSQRCSAWVCYACPIAGRHCSGPEIIAEDLLGAGHAEFRKIDGMVLFDLVAKAVLECIADPFLLGGNRRPHLLCVWQADKARLNANDPSHLMLESQGERGPDLQETEEIEARKLGRDHAQ